MAILTPPLPPEPLGMSDGVYAVCFPPFLLVAHGVEGAVVGCGEGHGPLVTDLAAHGARLGITDMGRFAAPIVVCNDEHRFIVAEQLREIGMEPAEIGLEPDGRNTAPAVAAAAFMASRDDEGRLLLVLPSDHVITDLEGSYRALDFAAPAAQGGMLVTFGMTPSKVESGYGHIRCGGSLDDLEGCYRVARFVEKPEAAQARSMLTEGGVVLE